MATNISFQFLSSGYIGSEPDKGASQEHRFFGWLLLGERSSSTCLWVHVSRQSVWSSERFDFL